MDTKFTDQMERDWMEQEFRDQSMDCMDGRVLLGTCAAIAMFIGAILATAG